MPPRVNPGELAERIRAGDRSTLARAITRIESNREDDQEVAYETLRLLMPAAGAAHRIGVSGPPGVGKSTLIDALGLLLVAQGHKVAVLAIDPSSTLSGGSILGDKSRMPRLAQEERAFIRPSPSDLALGGVTRRTREAMFLCEAAGFDRILIETVGVGQSEIQVSGMVDTFVVLIQPGAGDELQGIKRGIVELADLLVVTKADGDHTTEARQAVAEYSSAVRLLARERPVLAVSALEAHGLEALVERIDGHREAGVAAGELEARRLADGVRWVEALAEERLIRQWRARARAQGSVEELARRALAGDVRADRGAAELTSS